jgi:hypothetical protein
MTLSPQDYKQLQWLLGKSIVNGVDDAEESEIRRYIVQEFPTAVDLSFHDLIDFGMIYVGMMLLAEKLSTT